MIPQHLRRLAVLAASALAIASLSAASSSAADPSPARPGPVASGNKVDARAHYSARPTRTASSNSQQPAAGRASYFVRFKGAGAADLAKQAGGGARGVSAAKARRAQVSRIASGVLSGARKADSNAARIFTVANAQPGAGLRLNAAGFKAVARNANVASVSRIVPKTARMQSVDSLIKASNVWKFSGNTGKGVTIGIVDTGIDYTHADFGGPGTVAGFEAADATDTSATWVQNLPKKAKKKFAGGYDFAGDGYDANAEFGSPFPAPDPNPLDCNGHGSHVAGTAAGYGVTSAGKPIESKKYPKLNSEKLLKMKIGPGVAPQAKLFALRVFGCEGSTDLVIPALDKALDPNSDGNFSDHLDIINASLGSDYGPQDDPEDAIVNEIVSHGVIAAMSIGNNGDLTSTGGSPGNATSTIASASSVDKLELMDQIKVNAPAAVAGNKIGQMSVAYDWLNNGPTGAPVTGTVATLIQAGNEDGCAALNATDIARVAGKVAWLVWDDNDDTRQCGSVGRSANVKAAGAIGAIFTSQLTSFAAGITGDTDIPVFQLTKAGTDQLGASAAAGTLNVTFDGNLQTSFQRITPANTDTVSDFSSRGPHGSVGQIKPDVAAPGATIGSAGVGTGNRVAVISGTSMASPATAGVAALVKAAHPGWSPLKVKAAIMNTARHDVYTGPNKTGHKYGPARVGAGRVDAQGAVKTRLLAWTEGANNPVSASFGVVPAPITSATVTRTKKVQVKNLDNEKIKVTAAYEGIVSQPGVSYSVTPAKFNIKPKDKKTLTVTMTVKPSLLRHTIDPSMETDQLGVPRQFVSDASGRLLITKKGDKANRVPVFGAAKPTSATSVALDGNSLDVTGTGFSSGVTPSDWTSLLSVTEFGGTDEPMEPCSDPTDIFECYNTPQQRHSDIQHVGAGSNDDYLWLAMSTYSDWTNLILNSPDFLIDTDGNDLNGYEFNTFVAVLEATDIPVAVTIDLNSGDEDLQPINFNFGDVDTNTFDSNVVLLPIDKEFIGLDTAGSHPIVYDAANWNAWEGGYTDFGPVVEYDAGTPNVGTADELYEDTGGSTIALDGTREDDAAALIVHLHGAKGARTEIVEVPAVP